MDNQAFFTYLDKSLTPYHAAENSRALLANAGFMPLPFSGTWALEKGGRYMLTDTGGLSLAFVLPKHKPGGCRLIGTHNDSPALRLKPAPAISREGLTLFNIEQYGGMIATTWFDRDLFLCGRIYCRGAHWNEPKEHLIQLPEILTIPSLAAHMKRAPGEVNAQTEMLPVWGLDGATDLEMRLAEAAGVRKEDILSTELYLASAEKARTLGAENALYASSRIDNLANVYAATQAISSAKSEENILLFVSHNHEEIGSGSRFGAKGPLLSRVLERIAAALAFDKDALLSESILLSADQAHAAHPNYPAKADPVLRPHLGEGPVLKLAASHSYATTARGEAMFRGLCQAQEIPYQIFANRADMRGGSTIGPLAEIASGGLEAIDIGSPMLAMHSIRELASLRDQAQMMRLMKAFLEN